MSALTIDISRLMGRAASGRVPTGIDRVCLQYVSQFGARARAVVQWRNWRRIAPARESQQLFELLLGWRPGFARAAANVIARACLPPWPAQDGGGGIYLNLSHSQLEDVRLLPWLARTRQRPVTMVHDLIPITHPEYCREGERARHASRLEAVLRSSAGIITNSHFTRTELLGFAAARNLPIPPVLAAPLGSTTLQLPAGSAPPLDKPYFVVLSTIEPRKNHLLLLQIWREIVRELGSDAPHLVIIGQRGWKCANVVDMLDHCEGISGFVHELSACSDDTLARYLGHARALLFPSFCEGFGLPLVEALALGTPAIVSTLDVFREIAGDVPDYLHPLDGAAWRDAIIGYSQENSPQRSAQLLRLSHFAAPSWQAHFAGVGRFIEMLA